jgi:hypothetical protein
MNTMTHEIGPVDNLCLNSDLESAFRSYRPSSTATTYQGVIPQDGVALSQESSDDNYDEGDGLCSNLMAAWG